MTAEPEKFKLSQYLKEMKGKIMSHGKSFAVLGLMFSFTECTIESVGNFKSVLIFANKSKVFNSDNQSHIFHLIMF